MCAIALTCAAAAVPVGASAHVSPAYEEWYAAPLATPAELPHLAAWHELAARYFAAVPETPAAAAVCDGPPVVRVLPGDHGVAGWGVQRRPATTDLPAQPCTIWFEADDLQDRTTWAPWQADQAACRLYAHEYGHTLGLGHDYTGDPYRIMNPAPTWADIPPFCTAAHPAPAAAPPPTVAPEPPPAQTVKWRPRCWPGWADLSTRRVKQLWRHGHRHQARRAFRAWAKTHPKRAKRARRARTVCW